MKKFYITTSIAYTNAPPHIGFALESIQADVLARYHKKLGEDVFFLTGTDEHGIKIAKAAVEAGEKPQVFVDKISKKFKKLGGTLNLSNNDFIRTSDQKRHWPSVKNIWLKLKENGDIYKKKYKGFYCSGCEAFITEKDLVDGKCLNHQISPDLVEEENYFFRLSKYLTQIEEKIKKDDLKIIPETRKNEVLGYIKTGFGDVSFSRAKEKYWGFPVPGDDSQIIYVWGDALPNYISALGYAENSKKFKKYWPVDIHCIGKDILKFHALIWPGMLLSLGLPLPKAIFVHGFITVGGQKMSKSLGNVIGPFGLVDKYGTDAVRYYLLREIPSAEDGDFTYEKFEARYNSDLASGLGNLVARINAMVNKLKIKKLKIGLKFKIKNLKLKTKIQTTKKKCKITLENFRFNEALKTIWELISFCDKYIEQERPWENKDRKVIEELLFALDNIADLLEPFLPETSEKIKRGTAKSLFPRC